MIDLNDEKALSHKTLLDYYGIYLTTERRNGD